MAEKEIHKAIMKYLREHGAYVVKTAPPIDNGTPDLLCCLGGLFIGIEVKQPGKSPTKIQNYRMKQIKEAGGVALVATGVEDLKQKFEALTLKMKKARAAAAAGVEAKA